MLTQVTPESESNTIESGKEGLYMLMAKQKEAIGQEVQG